MITFNSKKLKEAGFKKQLKELKQKHTGGKSAKKGQRYEDYFALYKIAKNASEIYNKKVDDVEILDQVQNCFVDDIVIVKKKANKITCDFYQLKDTVKLHWNKRLLSDFNNQKKYSDHHKENFSLVLVTSNESLLQKLTKMPSNSFKNTFIKLFEAPSNCEDLIQNYEHFETWLRNISGKRNPTQTDLDSLAKTIQSEWINMANKKFVSIKTIIEKSNKETVPTRMAWDPPQKWKKAEEILKKIPKLKIYTDRGILEYEIEGKATDGGIFQAKPNSTKLDKLIDRIIKKKPTTVEKFEELFL